MPNPDTDVPQPGERDIAFARNGGVMGERLRVFDWAATPLGPIDRWPPALRTTVGIILNSRFPAALVWGPSLTTIHNDAFLPILGNKPNALGRSFRDVWSEAWETIGPIAERAFAGEATFIEDFPLVVERNGFPEQTYFTFCYSPVRDEHGTVVGMIDTVVETTNTVNARTAIEGMNVTLEHEVALRSRDLDRVWRNSRDILLTIDADGTLHAVSPAWTGILGHDDGAVIGGRLLDFLHPDDADTARRGLEAAWRGESATFETRLFHKDGGERWLSWTTAREEDLVYASGRHVTAEKTAAAELELAREALRQSQKMESLGQLTGGVAHDFNNLLQAIGGSLELAERGVRDGNANVGHYMLAARQSVERAAAMTQRLLAFSRRQPLQPRSVDLNALVTGMTDLIRRSVGSAIRVETDLTAGLRPVWADANQVESALLNLAINARDAMPAGGTLTLTTAATARAGTDSGDPEPGDAGIDPFVRLSVADTGTGMPPDVLERAFEPFFTTKPIGQGTGLGLSQVHGFVHQSGGLVRIASVPGRGTTVTLYLPSHQAADGPDAPTAPEREAPPADHQGTILLVEDEALVRMVIADTLADQGYTVLEAEDGPAALDVLESDTPVDLLVTDVGLPGMNGRQLAERARTLRPGLKVLFLTGYAHNADMRAEALGPGTRLLSKPVPLDALMIQVAAMLDGHADEGA